MDNMGKLSSFRWSCGWQSCHGFYFPACIAAPSIGGFGRARPAGRLAPPATHYTRAEHGVILPTGERVGAQHASLHPAVGFLAKNTHRVVY